MSFFYCVEGFEFFFCIISCVLQSDAMTCVTLLDNHDFKGRQIGVALSDPSLRKGPGPAGGRGDERGASGFGGGTGGFHQSRSYQDNTPITADRSRSVCLISLCFFC